MFSHLFCLLTCYFYNLKPEMIDNAFCSATENVAAVLSFIPVQMDLILTASSFTHNFTLQGCVCVRWIHLVTELIFQRIPRKGSYRSQILSCLSMSSVLIFLSYTFLYLGTFAHYSGFFWKNTGVEKSEASWIPPLTAFFVSGWSHSLQLTLLRACSVSPCKRFFFSLVY